MSPEPPATAQPLARPRRADLATRAPSRSDHLAEPAGAGVRARGVRRERCRARSA
jgi:hypothetical protein